MAFHLFKQKQPIRLAFARFLDKVARAMESVEWADSGDTSQEDADKAIMTCLLPMNVLEEATVNAKEALADLQKCLKECEEKE